MSEIHHDSKTHENIGKLWKEYARTPGPKRFSKDLLAGIQDALHREPRALSYVEFTKELGLPADRANRIRISYALDYLNRAGVVLKLPSKGTTGFWVHYCHKETSATIPHWHSGWQILQALSSGKKPLRELDNISEFREQLQKLQNAGMISVTGGQKSQVADLALQGEKLMARQKNSAYLLPETRDLLLKPVREPGALTTNEQRLLQRIRRWALVKQALDEERARIGAKGTYEGTAAVAKKLGEAPGFVFSVAKGKVPWRQTTAKKMRELYLPQLRKTTPALVELIENELKK